MSELDDAITTRAVLISPDGTAAIRRVGRNLADWQQLVGGSLEGLTLTESVSAYINEEGKYLGLEANEYGDVVVRALLARSGRTLLPGDYIAGPLVLVGVPDRAGWDTDVPDAVLAELRRAGLEVTE